VCVYVKPDFSFVGWLNYFCQSRCDCVDETKINSAVAKSDLGFIHRSI
jgi:hypothetical protein